MTADLEMAQTTGGTIFKVDAAENGIFAITLADFDNSLLNARFFAQIFELRLALLFELFVISEEIGLREFVLEILLCRFGDNIIGGESNFADSEFGIDFFVVNFE